MMTQTELNVALEEYYNLSEQLKTWKNKQEKMKLAIIEAMNGELVTKSADFQAKVSQCTRMTLLETQVQQKYNINFVDEDYHASPYVTLRVTPVHK